MSCLEVCILLSTWIPVVRLTCCDRVDWSRRSIQALDPSYFVESSHCPLNPLWTVSAEVLHIAC
jgi:hypothetical protein